MFDSKLSMSNFHPLEVVGRGSDTRTTANAWVNI